MSAVTIVDYGGGNIASVRHALARLGVDSLVAATPETVAAGERLILPGVGSGGAALAGLRARGLDDALDRTVRQGGRPLLGICVGMQILAERIYEFGTFTGLGWFKGEVVHLTQLAAPRRVPHMGWNTITPSPDAAVRFGRLRGDRQFYFCHSFALRCDETSAIAATSEHGGSIVAAVSKDSIMAVQFHPEKSELNGEALFQAFLEWKP